MAVLCPGVIEQVLTMIKYNTCFGYRAQGWGALISAQKLPIKGIWNPYQVWQGGKQNILVTDNFPVENEHSQHH